MTIVSQKLIKNSVRAGVTLICLLGATNVQAADFSWDNSSGGNFEDASNWNPQIDAPPVNGDIANFNLANTYTVDFNSNVTNTRLNVTQGNTTFNLNGNTYSLTEGTRISGSNATLNLQNGTLEVDSEFPGFGVAIDVGQDATGTLNISNGGILRTIDNSELRIADFPTSNGSVTVTGSGSKIEVANALFVAGTGQANLNILDGATVSSNFAAIAEGAGNGNVLISGTNSQLSINTFLPLGSNTNPDAIASLTVQDGGKLTVAGDIVANKSSTISGDGTIEVGGFFSNEGTVAPGTSLIGDLTVDGNFSQFDTGRLSLDIAGTTTDLYEQLFVSGDLFFDGTLRLSFIDGFSPSAGDEFLLTG